MGSSRQVFDLNLDASAKGHLKFAKGVSQAGLQQGLSDARSSLVKETFRVFDTLANGCKAQCFDIKAAIMDSFFNPLKKIN